MQIPKDWLDAVVFLGTPAAEGELPSWRGTGFLLSAPTDDIRRHLFVVTARHNIEAARAVGTLFVRVNTRDGRASTVETTPWIGWTFHPDDSVDLAVASASILDEISPGFALASEQIWTDRDAEGIEFGVGSELFTIGLFGNREGVDRNIPVVRTGILSAIVGELIDDRTGNGPYSAYLAEILSMGGMSGSPVLFHPTQGTAFPRVSFYLIGVIRSHWDERPPDAAEDLPRGEWLNKGIAAVTPAVEILTMLNRRSIST